MNNLIRAETNLQLADGENLTNAFLASQDVKPSSKKTYRKALKRFLAWVASKEIPTPDREDILAYKDSLKAEGLSPFTVSSYLVAVRKFYEWAESKQYYPNIAKSIKGIKKPKGFRKDALTPTQIKTLLSDIDRSTLSGKRDYALLNLMVRTGLRTIEIVRTNIEDIRQEGGEAILWIQGKGQDSKDDFVLLTNTTLYPIREYLIARGQTEDTAPLFCSLSHRSDRKRLHVGSVSRLIKTHLKGVGLDSGRLTAHSLRHTAITLSLNAGATIQEAQALGRHANIATTMIYAHNIDRIKNAPERKIDTYLDGLN
jgi:integrase/recombinase XerD